MKAKTIVGLMACAVLAPAFADNNAPGTNDWFSTSASGSTISSTGATWASNESAPSAESGKLVIDADTSTPATLAPTAADADTNGSVGLVTITSTAYLAPSALADLPAASALGNAQVGFAVATVTAANENTTSSFYGYVRKTPTTSGNETVQDGEWIALSGATPPSTETDTEFKIDLDYVNNKVSFSVKVGNAYVVLSGVPDGGTSTSSFDFVPADSNWLTDVAALGSGTITSIDAKYEAAVAVKGSKRYSTIAAAYNSSETGDVQVWDASKGAAAQTQTAANGLSRAECLALNIAENAAIALEPAEQADAGKITVKTVVNPVDDVTVGFKVVKVTGEAAVDDTSYPANAIKLPKTTGQYRIQPTVGAKSSN